MTSLPENDIKEALSIAYVQAVCGMAGCLYGTDSKDYGFDITIKDVVKRKGGKCCPSGYNLDVQIKATTDYQINETCIKYGLRNKNYNDLADSSPGTPRILIVLVLPQEKESWLVQDIDSLIMKKCAYWICLKGQERKANENSSTTIEIPIENIFSVAKLCEIVTIIKKGGDLSELSN